MAQRKKLPILTFSDNHSRAFFAISVLASFGLSIFLQTIHAAGFVMSVEPETGQMSGNAAVYPVQGASKNLAIKFGATITADPYGFADSCGLEGTNTVIYGWASDPNAADTSLPNVSVTLNGTTVTAPTNITGYRQATIDTWIDNHKAGDPKMGVYGFKAVFGTLTKGAAYPLTGKVINVGAGTDVALGVNTSTYVDSDISKPFFVNGNVPDACLGAGTEAAITKPCGNRTIAPAKYDHVIWIYEENHQYDQVINTSAAPYMTSLAKSCGTTTHFTDTEPVLVLHPELSPGDPHIAHSNQIYPANIHGGNCVYGNGISGTKCWNVLTATDKENLPWRTILDQLNEKGLTWKAYEENMPANCYFNDSGLYHNDHNPIFRLTSVRSQCPANDVKIPGISCPNTASACTSTPNNAFTQALANGTLPNFVHLIPNVDNMMHDGTVHQADLWAKMYVNLIVNSAEYKKGRTAIFFLWDEPSSTSDPNMPFLAISPSTTTGISTTTANGYAVLRATEQMFGITEYLGCASGTPWHEAGKAAPSGSSCYPGATTNIRTLFNM